MRPALLEKRTYNAARGDQSSVKSQRGTLGRTTTEIDSKRRSIQSYIGINFFSSKNLVFTMPQIALFSAALSVLNNALTNEVRIEES